MIIYVYRLRVYKDAETLFEEVSAVAYEKTLWYLYNMATEEPYCFWYVKLTAKSKYDMFYINFHVQKLIIKDRQKSYQVKRKLI